MKSLFYAFAFIALYAAYSAAAMVTMAWDYPTPMPPNVKGFRVYFGSTSHASVANPADMTTAAPYEHRAEEANPNAREIVIPIDEPGIYYFRMTAYGDGVDSAFSEEMKATIGPFSVPTNLRIESMTITFSSGGTYGRPLR